MTCRAAAPMRLHVWNLFSVVVALFAMTPPAMAVQYVATQHATVRMAVRPLAKTPASPACSPSSSTPSITLPAVTISSSQSNGLIGSPSSISVTFDCSAPFLTDSNFEDSFTLTTGSLAALDTTTAPPGGAGIMFTTNVPGIEVQLTAAQVQASGTTGWQMGAIQCISYTPTNSNWVCTPANTITVTFTAQLVKTGTVVPGTVNSISLLQFFDQDTYIANYGSNPKTASATNIGTLTLNAVTVSAVSCKVTASGGGTVTLPDVWQSALASSGSVAGATSFSIAVSGCGPTLSKVQTYFSSNTVDSTTHNLVNTSGTGYAGNVEVQLLDGQNANAAINLSNTTVTTQTATTTLSGGGATLNYQAQYYATGAATAGSVKTTAQFTMVYQ